MTPDIGSDPRPGWTAWSLLLLVAVILTVAGMFYQLVRIMPWPTWPGWFEVP